MEINLNKQTFIVDDDPFWSALLQQMLDELGVIQISNFENGSQCIEEQNQNPDLIFLDYQMEGIDGLEVLKKNKRTNPNTRVIFCIALEDLDVAANAFEFGSFDFLLKQNANTEALQRIMANIYAI